MDYLSQYNEISKMYNITSIDDKNDSKTVYKVTDKYGNITGYIHDFPEDI